MCLLALTCWVLTVMKEVTSALNFGKAVATKVLQERGATRIVAEGGEQTLFSKDLFQQSHVQQRPFSPKTFFANDTFRERPFFAKDPVRQRPFSPIP